MRRERLNFFKQLWIALFRPDQYDRLALVGTGRMIGFVCLFSLFYVIIWIGSVFITLDLGRAKEMVMEEIPDFYLDNGELHLEEPYNFATKDYFLCADSEIEKFELSDLEYMLDTKGYHGVILISKSNLLIYDDNQLRDISFSDFKGKRYTRDGLLDMCIRYIRVSFVIFPFLIFPFLTIIHFIASLLLALLAMIFSAILKKGLSAGQVYRIGIYSYTAIRIVDLVFKVYLTFIPDSIAQLIYLILAFVYTIIGVLSVENYLDVQRQEMAQRVSTPYNGYGNMMGYGYQDAFSNEPIEVPQAGSPTGGIYGSGHLANGNGMNAENGDFSQSGQGNGYLMESSYYDMNVIGNKGMGAAQAYPTVPEPMGDTVTINGIVCQKSDLDLVDKYLVIGLKDSAVDTLCQLLKCTRETAEEVIENWEQYFHRKD
ncbi:MAG: DUF1189 domain-containing protein [Lachnospiraceae bacterium]|nr:DUF1189 domain-containing protein [Lachnospiraceae bacterium]